MENIIEHRQTVTKEDRQKLLKQKSPVVWLTGLSGSGKSTVANELAAQLHEDGVLTYILDGDNVRQGLNKDLGFTDDDRKENIRRIAEVAKLISDTGVMVITAFISPFREERGEAKNIIGEDNFIEVFVDAPLDVCEERDPKGLYKKARAGEIPMFTGIDSPYEAPLNPDMVVETGKMGVDECAGGIMVHLTHQGLIDSHIPKEVDNLDKKKTISIDFDGVIHRYSDGFRGLYNAYDPPMEGAIEALKQLSEQGYELKILSSRPKDVIYPWLEKYGISHLISEVSNHKFPATVYIDDRGYHFESWETTMKELQNHPKINN